MNPIDVSTPTQRREKRIDGEYYQRASEEGNVKKPALNNVYHIYFGTIDMPQTYGYNTFLTLIYITTNYVETMP